MIEILEYMILGAYLLAVIVMLAAVPISVGMMIYSAWKGD